MSNTERLSKTLDDLEALLVSFSEAGITELPCERSRAQTSKPPAARATTCDLSKTTSSAIAALARIADDIAQCVKCPLHATRRKTVPGQGCPAPDIMFVGEAPGVEEDQSGLAFVGPAGKLLSRIITAMGLTREQVLITNVLKCSPPKDRMPLPGEVEACLPFLHAQIQTAAPKIIIALGPVAAAAIAGQHTASAFVPGAWGKLGSAEVLVTYHPALLLQHEDKKKQVWEDMKAVLAKLGLPVPQASSRPRR